MPPIESRVDWNGIKACLARLHREGAGFLGRSVVIGGAASWFYRIQLRNMADPDFREPPPTDVSEQLWLSKDIDFTGVFRGDAIAMLPAFTVKDERGNFFLQVNGIRLGFAQAGVTFDPEEVFAKARVAEFESDDRRAQFLVIDPISLFREKQALSEKRNQPNDRLHLTVVREELALEFVKTCEAYVSRGSGAALADQRRSVSFLIEVKERALEILHEERVRTRIRSALEASNTEALFVRERIFDGELK